MLISKEVEIRWSGKNKKWYIEKGYKYTKHNDVFIVKIEDVSKGSGVKIQCLCDYCLEEGKKTIISQSFIKYVIQNLEAEIHKDCCKNCQSKKVKETFIKKYNVDNAMRVDLFKEKSKHTKLERYGVDSYSKTEEFKEKFEKTSIEKYGFKTNLMNEDIKNQIRKTNIERYGFENPMQNPEIALKTKTTLNNRSVEDIAKMEQKRKNTNLERYGETSPMKVKEISLKSRVRANISLYNNKTMSCSKQQEYIWKLIGGELNYPVNYCSLDIAFPNDMLYVEYDGSGHDLRVLMGDCTKEEFHAKEIKRHYYLKKLGWRRIRIISKKNDLLPPDSILSEIISMGLNYLNTGHSWIEFDIDASIISCSQHTKEFDYGELRKIKEEDLKQTI